MARAVIYRPGLSDQLMIPGRELAALIGSTDAGPFSVSTGRSSLTGSNTLQTLSIEAAFLHALRNFIGLCSIGVDGLVLHLVA